MENILNFSESELYINAEKAAFEIALAASSVPNAVDETISCTLHNYWDEGEIVEILAVVSLFGYLKRCNSSMGKTMESGTIDAGNRLLQKVTGAAKSTVKPRCHCRFKQRYSSTLQ